MVDIETANKMLQRAINQTLDVGIKCGKIMPTLKINQRASSFWGKCHIVTQYKGENIYQIEVSKHTLDGNEESIMNTICHEVLHSCDGCMNHGVIWKTYASRMNRKYGYDIKRSSTSAEQFLCSCGGDLKRIY